MKQLKTLLLSALSLSFGLVGCIGDEMSDCPPDNSNFSLAFYYPDFPEHISRVTVGIYNANGLLADARQVEKNELDIYRGINLNLSGGSYTAICWGNASDNTLINGLYPGGYLSMHEVAHPGYFTATPIPTNDTLYYGIHTFSIHTGKTTNDTVNFIPAHIRLIVQIKGLASIQDGAPPADYPYIRVNNLAPAYDYKMTTHGSPTTYYPPVTVDTQNELAEAACYVLRFKEINPITIEVVENHTTNTILHTVDLQSFIADNGIVIEEGKETVIPILITFDGKLNVTVIEIEAWKNIPVDPVPQQ